MVHLNNGILINVRKEMSYPAMKSHGISLNAYYYVTEANLQDYNYKLYSWAIVSVPNATLDCAPYVASDYI